MKPLFEKRIRLLLGEEATSFYKILFRPLPTWIRCNTLKITTQELFSRIKKKWEAEIFFREFIKIKKFLPGEVGNSLEHQLGYYYVQDLASMMPALALAPKKHELVLDLCASPGGKSTQIAAAMKNTGLLIANDVSAERTRILRFNLTRCGVTNVIVTKEEGSALCKKISNIIKFDRILIDAPCSGEGIARTDAAVLKMWNIHMIKKFSKIQKKLCSSAIQCLKDGGVIVYSTCTHAPEENEEVIQFLLENFDIKIEKIDLPIKTRSGIEEWQGQIFDKEIKNCCRIWPQDNNTQGFFIAKIRKK